MEDTGEDIIILDPTKEPKLVTRNPLELELKKKREKILKILPPIEKGTLLNNGILFYCLDKTFESHSSSKRKWNSMYEKCFKKDLTPSNEKALRDKYSKRAKLTEEDKLKVQQKRKEEVKERKTKSSIVKHSATFKGLKKIGVEEAGQLVNLSDLVFEGILENNMDKLSDMNNFFLPLLTAANEGSCESKMSILARLGIMPTLRETKSGFPRMINSLLGKFNANIVYSEIFMPLFQDDFPIHKALLETINLRDFIVKVLIWLEKTDKELTPNRIEIIKTHLAKVTYLEEVEASLLIKLIQRSLSSKPNNVKYEQFFSFLVKRFIDSFTEAELDTLRTINNAHNTSVKSCNEEIFRAKFEVIRKGEEFFHAIKRTDK